jgi:glutamine synthetase
MYIEAGPHGTSTLYVPSVFISYNGEALDEKTILLRSNEVLSTATVRLLHLLGETDVKRAYTTLGTEQEFFLVDRALYQLRPDLKICGRTLIGNVPPKHQQLEDHYFGRIPSRVLAAISECELECYKLGVPIKTRHNEVAPAQFEMAPIFEESAIAVDHNLLTMQVLHRVAHRHKLKALFHEKPFKGINGSGKHCNWAVATDLGDNLLDPTVKPETNYRFLLFLVATLWGVFKNGGVLRAGIASASNDKRLGAAEAPPGIISAFLGEQLTEVLDSVTEGREVRNFSVPHVQAIKVGGTVLDLKVSTLPPIARDLTDRNRTSPFAFTGNKFEFRAVGGRQSPSFPVTLLNTIVSVAVNEVADALEKQKGSKTTPSDEDKIAVIKQFIDKVRPVCFEGDGYSQEWVDEAAKRGLPNIKRAPDAFKQLLLPANVKALTTDSGVFNASELEARFHILTEKYIKDVLIEAETLVGMIRSGVLPAAIQYRKELADAVKSVKDAGSDATEEKKMVDALGVLIGKLSSQVVELEKHCTHATSGKGEEIDHADYLADKVVDLMDAIRVNADAYVLISL